MAHPTITVTSRDNDSSGLHGRRSSSKSPTKYLKMPVTPPRMSPSNDDNDHSISPRPNRERTSSREFTHSYDGKYGAGNDFDMAGVDIRRTAGQWWEDQMWLIFSAYVIVLVVVGLVVTMIMSLFEDTRVSTLSGTVTNVIHFLVTLIYLHWTKGCCGWDQGDLDYMTEWEIIEYVVLCLFRSAWECVWLPVSRHIDCHHHFRFNRR